MGKGTIQQGLGRIKGRLHLWWYDSSADIRRTFAQLRSYLEAPRGQALMDVISIVSVAIIAFALGQMSATETKHQSIIHDTSQRMQHLVPQQVQGSTQAQGKIVASRKGKRWHYVWCSGAATISDKNKRYFKTEADAEKAGFTKASNCK